MFAEADRHFSLDTTLELYCFKSLTKPTFRPTFDLVLEAGITYTVKCEAADGKATVFVSQVTRMP